MNLSKAFDNINHGLLIAKLHAYRYATNALKIISSLISGHWQRSKISKLSTGIFSRNVIFLFIYFALFTTKHFIFCIMMYVVSMMIKLLITEAII